MPTPTVTATVTPTVTAIVTVFDRTTYLAEAITSVLDQTHPVHEVIVVDDGSTVDLSPVLAPFGDAIRVVRQDNRGDAAARNLGVALATGEVLAFLDDDDVWTPHKVAVQLAALTREPGPVVVFGHIVQFASPELAPGLVVVPDDADVPVPGPMNGTLMVTRSTFEAIGPFPEPMDGTGFVDWYARVLDQEIRTVIVPEVVLRRRHHLGNLGRVNNAPVAYARALRRVIERRRGRASEEDAR